MYRMYDNPNTIHRFRRTVGLAFDLNQGSATYGFKTATAGQLTPSAGSGYGFGMAFQFTLANVYTWHDASGTSATWPLPNISEFSALFDSYRLRKVQLRMMWNQNVSQSSAGFVVPFYNICNDDDDANPPLGPLELVQRAGCRVIAPGAGGTSQVHIQTIYPKANMSAASSSGGTVQMTQVRNAWYDTNDLTTNFYGCKMRWDAMSGANLSLGSLIIYVDYFIECKGFK